MPERTTTLAGYLAERSSGDPMPSL